MKKKTLNIYARLETISQFYHYQCASNNSAYKTEEIELSSKCCALLHYIPTKPEF